MHLAGTDLVLTSASVDQLVMGANRALLGGEIIQFTTATAMGNGVWQLSGLMRGRGSTESAIGTHQAGEPFVLLDTSPITLDSPRMHGATTLAAIGLPDTNPVEATILCQGYSQRPWSPVHPETANGQDGSLTLSWTRRARGGWAWVDGIDMPLQEQTKAYLVALGGWNSPIMQWQVSTPEMTINAATYNFNPRQPCRRDNQGQAARHLCPV